MTRTGAGALVALAVAAGLGLRAARLDVRPMHHDEANQAVKFGALLERGEYRYDAHDHHGPTLYYLSLPAAWLRGQHTLAALDERTIRGVTAAFGVATILLLPLLADAIGWTAVAAAAVLMAVSPAMVFYSRMFIQESLFACFTLAFVVACGRLATGGGLRWAMVAGLAAGLAVATKETSAIVVTATLAAGLLAWWSLGPVRDGVRMPRARCAAVAAAMALVVAALFYSSFLTFPAGAIEPFLAVGTYLDRGVDPARHAHPWHYYLGLLTYRSSGGLTWSEALIVGLGVVGIAVAWGAPRARWAARRRAADGSPAVRVPGDEAAMAPGPVRVFWARYVSAYTLITLVVFSAIAYKTPWNLLPFHVGLIVVAGIGVSRLVEIVPGRFLRLAIAVAFAAASAHLAVQAWRGAVVYAADPRNPYVYAQTVPDAVRMAARIRNLAAVHPEADGMLVSVVASPYEQWPLPWYLRAMPHVGYWNAPGDALALRAPVVVASLEHAPALDAALDDRYVSEFYGLRPDILLVLYVERDLWERFLARASGGAASRSGASPAPVPPVAVERPAVSLWPPEYPAPRQRARVQDPRQDVSATTHRPGTRGWRRKAHDDH